LEFRFGDQAIAINMADTDSLLQELGTRLASGRGFALATLNLDHLVKLSRSAGFRRAYAAHDLVVADGNPVVWLSRLAGRPVSLVPGSDLVLPLARLAAETGAPVALVGSTAPVLAAAATRLAAAAPGLSVVARIAPPFGFDPQGEAAAQVLAQLDASGARLCFLALGAPRQESFAARGRALLPHVGFASVGAGLDFIAGHQRRAPRWMRRMMLEWLWRMSTNPLRLAPRYARCAAILPGQVAAALRQRRARR
jgi:N-acetylglucosaminyldiphosphoundecaprenol N-acetyl-beta-D-mannosaminyltransferase